MQIPEYTFRSPYPSPVQVGHLDPSSVKKDASNTSGGSDLLKSTNQTEQKAERFAASQKQEVKPIVSENKIDIYA